MKLKEGIVLRPFGATSRIDNSNLTDEIGEWLLKTGKATKDQFEGKRKGHQPPANN